MQSMIQLTSFNPLHTVAPSVLGLLVPFESSEDKDNMFVSL